MNNRQPKFNEEELLAFAKSYLSEPEQVEQVTLKKRKLQLKDRMEDILRQRRASQSLSGPALASGADVRS